MVLLIIKKEDFINWTSKTKIINCNILTYKIKKWYYQKKGYEVEEIKGSDIE